MKGKLLASLLTVGLCDIAQAGDVPWSEGPYSHFSNRESVAEILKDLATSNGIPISISDGVRGTINASFEGESAEEVFETVVAAFSLNWYYDGHVLWMYTLDEVKAATVKLQSLPVSVFRANLLELGILDARMPWRTIASEGLIYLSGPQRYLELVQSMVAELDRQTEASPRRGELFSWVDERGVTHYSNEPRLSSPEAPPTGPAPIEPVAADIDAGVDLDGMRTGQLSDSHGR